MSVLYVIEQHDQLLDLWRSHNAAGLRIVHFDFHCDMRDLLVNCQSQLAFPSSRLGPVDEGNFLTHAIKEGRVSSVRWFHHLPGGRQFDVGTIRYTTDFTAQPLRWFLKLKGQKGIPIHYEVKEFSKWTRLNPGEFLDIDWDFFAGQNYPLSIIDARVKAFLDMDFGCDPTQISVCYSPRYSHPTRDRFELFVKQLAEKFGADVVVPQAEDSSEKKVTPQNKKSFFQRYYLSCRYQIRHLHYEGTLWFRQRGIY